MVAWANLSPKCGEPFGQLHWWQGQGVHSQCKETWWLGCFMASGQIHRRVEQCQPISSGSSRTCNWGPGWWKQCWWCSGCWVRAQGATYWYGNIALNCKFVLWFCFFVFGTWSWSFEYSNIKRWWDTINNTSVLPNHAPWCRTCLSRRKIYSVLTSGCWNLAL